MNVERNEIVRSIMIHSLDRKKLHLKFPISIYAIVFTYFFIAIGASFYVFSHVKISDLTSEMWIAILILFGTYLWPIQYKGKNVVVSLYFQLPILFLYGLFPVYLVTFFQHFIPKGYFKDIELTKRVYNFSNAIIPFTITYYIYSELSRILPASYYVKIEVIMISAFFLNAMQISGIAIMVYLEKGMNLIKHQYKYFLNVLASNVMNGIITYYLYQELHIFGIFIAVLYAILFSKRSQYQAAYDKKKIELSEVEQRAKMVFDTIDYGIIVLDHEQKVTLANPVALKVLDTLQPNPIGKNIKEIVMDYSREMYEIIQWTYEHQEKFEQKPVRSTINGETRYYDIHTYPQKNMDGDLVDVIFVYKNITEEQLVRRQLIEADKLSRLGQIAAGKVHEIKNPLSTVRGYLQFLKQKVANGDKVKLHSFDIALQEIDRTNELINSLLILSKQPTTEVKRIHLNDLLDEVVQLFQHQLLMNNITFIQNIDEELWVNGVENHLKQILINLFLNAIDAVSAKNEDSQITLYAKEEGNNITIEIEDNGIGISQKDIAKLSIPFFTTKETGTGLGLSVTYKLIEEHDGTIKVFSEIGQGTIFTIQLPSARVKSTLMQEEAVFS